MTVWSDSITRERPLRSSSSLSSMPLFSTPMSVLTMKMPPSVTTSIATRKPTPASPPMVPASSVRIRLSHMASPRPSAGSSGGRIWPTVKIRPATKIISAEIIASPRIKATVPLAM